MIGRVATASGLAILLVAGALMLTLLDYRGAVNDRQRAADAIADAAATQAAEKDLSREREALGDALLGLGPNPGRTLEDNARRFREDLEHIGRQEPDERRLVGAGLEANDRLLTVTTAAEKVAPVAPRIREIDRKADAAEARVLAPLQALRSTNLADQAQIDRSAEHASRRALVFAVIAGAFAIAGGIAFGWYAIRLLRGIAARNERLRRLDQLKDDFVAAVSHELRTPLTSIQGYVELVLEGDDGNLTADQRQFLDIVRRNADRLHRVAGDLLFVAQVEAGTISLQRERTDLNEIVRQGVETARPAAAARQLELAVELAPSAEVDVDRARIGQVVDNLISNAVKFTAVGGHVTARTQVHGTSVILEVADDGMGMSEEEMEQLFERFFRAAAATEQAIQGTGLGLAITKAIVDAHGGVIAVTSETGAGTTFAVELPLAEVKVAV